MQAAYVAVRRSDCHNRLTIRIMIAYLSRWISAEKVQPLPSAARKVHVETSAVRRWEKHSNCGAVASRVQAAAAVVENRQNHVTGIHGRVVANQSHSAMVAWIQTYVSQAIHNAAGDQAPAHNTLSDHSRQTACPIRMSNNHAILEDGNSSDSRSRQATAHTLPGGGGIKGFLRCLGA